MKKLSVKFSAVDEMSHALERIHTMGVKALSTFDKIGYVAGNSYDTISIGSSEVTEAFEKATQATDYWTSAIGNYDKGAMEAVYTTQELVGMGYKTENALDEAARALENTREEMDKYRRKTEESTEEMDKHRRKTEESTEEMDKHRRKTEESINAFASLEQVIAAAGIGIAIKKIGEEFLQASQYAAEFEKSVAKVSTVADTTVLSTNMLATQISTLSGDTAKNVNVLSESAYDAISAGMNTAYAVDTVRDATKLSEAGFTSVNSALSVLTTSLNAYQMKANEVTNISDSLIMSQNLGVMTIDQLSGSIGKAISTASAYSVDLYNLESGYVSLTKAGISVDE